MRVKPINFALIGRSGSGKGTQAKLLMAHFGNLRYIQTGDLFRRLAQSDSHTAQKIAETLQRGGLPFDDMATTLWMHEIAHTVKEDEGILFDGAPRRKTEAENLDRFMSFLERTEDMFPIFLDVGRSEARYRLSERRICAACNVPVPAAKAASPLQCCAECGGELVRRHDDTPEAIEGRLDYFDKNVVEVLEHYRNKNKLVTINGEKEIDGVFKDILKAVEV